MKTLRLILASAFLSIGGCAVTGSLEYTLPDGGTARLSSDGKTTNFAIKLPRGYSK